MNQQSDHKILFHDLRDTLGVEIVHGNVRHSFSRHTHRMLCVGVVESGVRVLLCRNEKFEVNPGEVFIIPPGEAHSFDTDGALHAYRLLLVSQDILDMILPNTVEERYTFKHLILNDDALFEQLLNLHTVLLSDETDFFKQTALISVVGNIVELSAQRCSDEKICSDQYERVNIVIDFIDANYETRFSLADIAKRACLSPYYLIRVFSKIVGIPPHIYQQQVRIRHAKGMLVQGTPIVEVAINTGFTDQSHFSNVFKKMVGLTPGEYLRSRIDK